MGIMDTVKNAGDLYKMQKEAGMMKKKMEEQKITGESRNGRLKLYMNGAQELENVYVDDEWLKSANADDVAKNIKEAYKDYLKKLQKVMVNSFDMDQIKGLLGK